MTLKNYDVAIALSKNWDNPRGVWFRDEEPVLRIDSKLCALAMGAFFVDGRTDNLLVCGGRTLGPDYASESRAMSDYAKDAGFDINSENLFLDEESFDTHSNALEAKRIISGRGFSSVALIACEPHLPRASKVFSHYGFSFDGFPAEKILDNRGGIWPLLIQAYRDSRHYQRDVRTEKVLSFVQTVNPSGSLISFISKRLPTRKH